MVAFNGKSWNNAPDGYREGDVLPGDATPLDADGLNDLESRVSAAVDAVNTALGLKANATSLASKVDTALIGQPNGVASLDGAGKVPSSMVGSTSGVTVVQATADATGVADTAALQGAIDAAFTSGGGTVRGAFGKTYFVRKQSVAAPYGLSVPSRVTVDMTGCTVVLVSGSDCPLLVDSGHAAVFASGSIASWSAPSDVRVIGGIWDKGSNTGSGNGLHTMILGGSGVTARDLHFKGSGGTGKFALLLQNITDFDIQNVFADNVASDGVHIHGPAARGVIRNVHGKTGDDLMAITPHDYPAYNWGNEGDVTDILIDGVFPDQGGSRALIILGGTNGATVFNTKRITARNISGALASAQAAVIIGDDTAQANTSGGQLDDIVVENVSVSVNSTTKPIVSIGGNSSSLTIPTVRLRNITLQGKDLSAAVSNNAKVADLIIDGITGTTATAPTSAGLISNATGNAWPSITRLFASNISATFAGTRGSSLISSPTSGQAIGEIFLSNVRLSNAAWMCDLITSCTIRASNVHMVSNGGIFNVRSPAAVIMSGWSGSTADTTSSTITSTGTLRSLDRDFPMDISNAQVTAARTDGDRCTARVTNGSVKAGQSCEYSATLTHWVGIEGNSTV